MSIFVNNDDLQFFALTEPFGVVSSTAGEVYDARREADVAGNQSWSEINAIEAEVESYQDLFEELYGHRIPFHSGSIHLHLTDQIEGLRKRDSRFLAPFDKERLDVFDQMNEALNRAVAEHPGRFKNLAQIREDVAAKARQKWEDAEAVASRASGFDRFLGEAGAGLVRDLSEPAVVLTAAITAPLAVEYFGASLAARGLGLAAVEGVAAGSAETVISGGLRQFWSAQGFSAEEIDARMAGNIGSATLGAALLSPALYVGGVLSKKVASAAWAKLTSEPTPQDVLDIMKQLEDHGVEFTPGEKVDKAVLEQRLKELEDTPPYYDKTNSEDMRSYQQNVQDATRAYASGNITPQMAEELTAVEVPIIEQAIKNLQENGQVPTREQIRRLVTPDEWDQHNARLKEARETEKARTENTPQVNIKKKETGRYTDDDNNIQIEKKENGLWKALRGEEEIGAFKTLKEAKERAVREVVGNREPAKTNAEILREVSEETLNDALSKRRGGPIVREQFNPQTPMEKVDGMTSPEAVAAADAAPDDSALGRFTDAGSPDKERTITDQELAQRIADGEFDDQLFNEADEFLGIMQGRTPEEVDLYARIRRELQDAESKIAEAEEVDNAVKALREEVNELEARAQELDAKEELTPAEKTELDDIQGRLFDIENEPTVMKIDLEKLRAKAASAREALNKMDEQLAARQPEELYAPQDVEEAITEFRETLEDEADLKNLMACVIRNGAT